MQVLCPYFEIHLAKAAKTTEEMSGVRNCFSCLCHKHKLPVEGTCSIPPQDCVLSTVCKMLGKYYIYYNVSILQCYNEEIKMEC